MGSQIIPCYCIFAYIRYLKGLLKIFFIDINYFYEKEKFKKYETLFLLVHNNSVLKRRFFRLKFPTLNFLCRDEEFISNMDPTPNP